MVKQLLTFAATAMLAFGASADTLELSLADLGSGWSSTYDPATKTITYTEAWAGRGWWLTDVDYSKYDEAVVEFNKVDFDVKLVVEYTNDIASSDAMAVAGKEIVKCELNPEGKAHVKQIYLQSSAIGTVTLKSAYLQNAKVFDPTKDVTMWEGSETLLEWGNAVTIPASDFKANKIAVGDKLRISYSAEGDGGSFKAIYVAQDWEWRDWPAFKAIPGVDPQWGTLFVNTPGSVDIDIDEEALKVLTDCLEIKIQGDKVTITKVEIVRSSGSSAITEVGTDNCDAPAEYFNLQGVRVSNPSNGLYIRRQGSEVKKVLVR